MIGDGASILSQLGRRARRYLVGAVLAGGAGAALIAMFLD
jgi:hypothetical protein